MIKHNKDIFNPWVMRAAWQKVQSWYMQGDWYDPAEMLAWKADPWRKLSKLANELSAGTYQPDPYPLIPYPKKGNKTRHFTMVSVEDQVAFATYLVLLGPFLESRMPNISFGNRLARHKVQRWEKTEVGLRNRWYRMPFSLSYKRVYEPFSSSYGLFRRLLQWITNRAFFEDGCCEFEAINDYIAAHNTFLPYCNHTWKNTKNTEKLYYLRLDLSLAYPSVKRDKLRLNIRKLLKDDIQFGLKHSWGMPSFPSLIYNEQDDVLEPEKEMFGSHPWHILKDDEELRLDLANKLMDLLDNVVYCRWEEPSFYEQSDLIFKDGVLPEEFQGHNEYADTWGLWRPDDPVHEMDIEADKYGLPTGNIISGLLMNVALTEVDLVLCKLYEKSQDGKKVVYLRFVDDLILLSEDWNALGEAVVVLVDKIKKEHKFKINTKKVRPDVNIIQNLLEDFCCSKAPIDEKEFLAKWGKIESLLSRDDYINRGNVDIFTTKIVSEMSDLNQEDIDERYGPSAAERVDSLLGLLNRKDSDEEVAEDARANFAINKLARSTWPDSAVKQDDMIRSHQNIIGQILIGAEQALRNNPWRIKLWRSVLTIVLRASIVEKTKAIEGFKKYIPYLLSWDIYNSEDLRSPAEMWEREQKKACIFKDQDIEKIKKRRCENESLRRSFHRAQFWREWAKCVRGLKAVANGDYSPFWSQYFTKEKAIKVLEDFGEIEQWLTVIYQVRNKDPKSQYHLWWWELEALSDAIMATLSPAELIEIAQELGDPRKGQFRADNSPLRLYLDRKTKGNDKLSAFNQALQTIMGYQGLEELVFGANECSQKFLWFSLTPTHKMDKKYYRWILPSSFTAKDWASLVRVGLWNRFDEIFEEEAPFFSGDGKKGDDIWNALIALDDYACIRKLVIANGKVLPWAHCEDIFLGKLLTNKDSVKGDSLFKFIYNVGFEKVELFKGDSLPPDGYLVQMELPWQLAMLVVKNITKELSEGIISPDTLIFAPGCLSLLTEARVILLNHGYETHKSNQRTIKAIEKMRELLERIYENAEDLGFQGLRSLKDSRAPHPMFLFPYLISKGHELAFSFNRALLLLWMISGSEYILDRLYEVAPWQPPLVERDFLRSNFLMPKCIWQFIDRGLCGEEYNLEDSDLIRRVDKNIERISVVFDDNLLTERDGVVWDIEDNQVKKDVKLAKDLKVRIVQLKNELDYSKWLYQCKNESSDNLSTDYNFQIHRLMSVEVGERLHEIKMHANLKNKEADQIAVFPEWSLPHNQVPVLKRFVEKTGIAILIGLLPSEVPRVVPVTSTVRKKGSRFLTNEAVLIIPEPAPQIEIKERAESVRERRRSFVFRIRKPFASVAELGLIDFLNSYSEHTHWDFLPGQAWTIFSYPNWGRFSVAICSDIIDTYIWDWLRGRIQHLFVVAQNKDTDLFDQLSWARSYELFSNIAIANHGCFGGSLVWTPKHSFKKRIFSTHGSGVGTSFSIELPVSSLFDAQMTGLFKGIKREVNEWRKKVGIENEIEKGMEKECESEFKTPPHRFILEAVDSIYPEAAATKEEIDFVDE